MIAKIKRGFWIFMGTIWITFLATIMASEKGTGGIGINGFITLIVWIAFMYLMIKVSIVLSNVAFTILVLVLSFTTGSITEKQIQGLVYIGLFCVGLYLVYLYSNYRDKINKKVAEQHKAGITCCPKCASTRIHYVQKREVTDEINYKYDEDGDIVGAIPSTHTEGGYYECDKCGKIFK
ncbi:hypothetical protein P261_00352 [Lachnospiraceae bacterium TWA4]|nr:hypothetical protein P261_00352 [Lachnospiraceae bacterium TWA4]